jgi:transcriptional regulator with XRE-family HTH domain
VESPDEARYALARRLRALREERWPDRKITQVHLAAALHVSAPLISAWENTSSSQLPSEGRLQDYATFFATDRSVARPPFKLLDLKTEEERASRDRLFDELTRLRSAAVGETPTVERIGGFWRFPASQDVTIVVSELPGDIRQSMPDPDPDSPDYVEAYKYSDLDALLELHGHIRAANPINQVNIRTPSELTTDDFTTHLVLLGGVDWNAITAEFIMRLEFPVQQKGREKLSDLGGFEVVDGGKRRIFEPRVQGRGDHKVLVEDVAHFFRAQHPFREERTVTICNGMFGRGTLGVVRALTDARFRVKNEEYLKERFGHDLETLSIVSRVPIIRGEVITPDWTASRNRLHEWPEVKP